MAYHFGGERRKGTDRREPRNAPFSGIERRLAERRKRRKQEHHVGGWLMLLVIVFLIVDTTVWDGAVRRGAFHAVDRKAEVLRDWSDHLWDR